jgi:predicted nucleotidyltransferase
MIPMQDIIAVAERMARAFLPEKIILFGSYAYGVPREGSDVDLLLGMPFTGRGRDVRQEIRRRIGRTFPMDLLVRRPDELARRYLEYDPLVREALDRGKVLYERDRARVG